MKKAKPSPRSSSRSQSAPLTDAPSADTLLNTAPPLLSVIAGALGLGALLCFLAAGLAFATGSVSSVWGWGLMVASLCCSVGAWLGRARSAKLARDAGARQRLALGANAVFSTVLLGVVLVGLNFVVTRHHAALDLTTNRINTLSPQTQRVLSRISGPLRLIYLYVPRQDFGGRPDSAAVSLLEAYRNASDRVTTEFVNAVADPARGSELNPRTPLGQYGASAVLLIERDSTPAKQSESNPITDRQETAILDEANVTSALLRLLDPKPRTFYYLTGHGELDPLTSETSLSRLRSGLIAQNVQLKPLSLIASGASIPADAATVFAVAPQADLSEGEFNRLQGYLNGSGHLALLFSPSRVALPRWSALLKNQGLKLGDGFVLDPDAQHNYQAPETPVGLLGDSSRHPILRGTSQSVLFPFSVALKAQPHALGLTSLFETSATAQSVAVRGAHKASITTGDFARGPYILAAAVQRGDSRFWITSSASFATDQWNPVFGNGSFALAGLNWTAGDVALVSIPPRSPVTNTLNAPSAALRFIQLFSLFTLPIFIFIAGSLVWWRRR